MKIQHNITLVTEQDAEFILEMRSNPKLNQHLNPTSTALEDQVKWIQAYKQREAKGEEFYFVIYENDKRVGLYRLYEINSISFTIGSWLFSDCQYKGLPILTDLAVTNLGFEYLNLPIMRFDIRKDNHRVVRYSAVKKPILFTEDAKRYYYILQKEHWEQAQANILKFFRLDPSHYQKFKHDLWASFKTSRKF